jgi:hypothetical protein
MGNIKRISKVDSLFYKVASEHSTLCFLFSADNLMHCLLIVVCFCSWSEGYSNGSRVGEDL